jgi:hypothetical protein
VSCLYGWVGFFGLLLRFEEFKVIPRNWGFFQMFLGLGLN